MDDYKIAFYYSLEDEAYIAVAPELPGCMADGETIEEAKGNIKVIIQEWIETAKEEGMGVPSPVNNINYTEAISVDVAKSITPQPKMGRWITKIKSDLRGDMWPTNPKCSECGGEPYYSNTIYNYKFCPNCGAKMIDPQESEGKE